MDPCGTPRFTFQIFSPMPMNVFFRSHAIIYLSNAFKYFVWSNSLSRSSWSTESYAALTSTNKAPLYEKRFPTKVLFQISPKRYRLMSVPKDGINPVCALSILYNTSYCRRLLTNSSNAFRIGDKVVIGLIAEIFWLPSGFLLN